MQYQSTVLSLLISLATSSVALSPLAVRNPEPGLLGLVSNVLALLGGGVKPVASPPASSAKPPASSSTPCSSTVTATITSYTVSVSISTEPSISVTPIASAAPLSDGGDPSSVAVSPPCTETAVSPTAPASSTVVIAAPTTTLPSVAASTGSSAAATGVSPPQDLFPYFNIYFIPSQFTPESYIFATIFGDWDFPAYLDGDGHTVANKSDAATFAIIEGYLAKVNPGDTEPSLYAYNVTDLTTGTYGYECLKFPYDLGGAVVQSAALNWTTVQTSGYNLTSFDISTILTYSSQSGKQAPPGSVFDFSASTDFATSNPQIIYSNTGFIGNNGDARFCTPFNGHSFEEGCQVDIYGSTSYSFYAGCLGVNLYAQFI